MRHGPPNLLPAIPERVLLLNSPVYDTRFHWSKWQQPTKLLKLVKYFRNAQADVKFIDPLYIRPGQRLHREKIEKLQLNGLKVDKWRFGTAAITLLRTLREYAAEGWVPDRVYVECFTTFWWEGAREIINLARQVFPHSHVVLIGAYAASAPDHARNQALADEVMAEPWTGLDCLCADFSLYPAMPSFSYLSLGRGLRTAEQIVEEITDAKASGIKQFVFAEDAVASQHPTLYQRVLEGVIAANLKVKFYALGNIAPSDFVAQPELARLMKQAGYAQIWLSDDRNTPTATLPDEQLIEHYRLAASVCQKAGFKARADQVIAAVSLGKLGESLSERVQTATLAAHHIGSVIFWAYQPKPGQCDDMPLEAQNGKLYPLRHAPNGNGRSYRDYLDVMGLAAVLNAKHRTNTFDFMGDDLISGLFRNSLERRAWEAADEIKGSIQLPMRPNR